MILEGGRYAQVDAMLEDINLYLSELAHEIATACGQGSAYKGTRRAAAQIDFVRRALLADEKKLDDGVELTPRERKVLSLLIQGQTNAQIGNTVGISERTVEKQVETIKRKFAVGSRVEAAVHTDREGVV